jgi:nitroreductase
MTNIIDGLKWRYATKKFDGTKTVSDADIATLKQAINLTATSFGLQPFRVAVVTDPAVKAKLSEAAYNQPQLITGSHIFVFATKTDMSPKYVDGFIHLTAETRGLPVESIAGYGDYIKGSLKGREQSFLQAWNTRQAYIALGSLLAAAGELKVDACPMEGFDAAKFDDILGLTAQGLTACVIAPVGHRAEEDQTQHHAKVRLPLEEMFM